MTAPINFKFDIYSGSEKRLVVLRKASGESSGHIVLKLLAYQMFFDDNLQVEADAFQHYKPDLVKFSEERNWKVAKWVDCGSIDARKLLKISAHNRQAKVYVFKDSEDGAKALKARVAKKAPKTSNIFYCVFDKNTLKILEEQMLARNEIIIENCFDMKNGFLGLIFNGAKTTVFCRCF